MFRILRKYWKYATTKLDSLHAEHADPRIALQQAIGEANDQHRRLTEQAAAVLGHQRRVHLRRERLLSDHARTQASLVNALRLIDEHRRSGNAVEAERLTSAAEAVAARLLVMEQELAGCERDLVEAAQAADAAKHAVTTNADRVRERLSERDRLLSDLDRAKLQEQVNAALRQVSSVLGDDVPTLDDVRRTIEARAARAEGMAALIAVESHSFGQDDLLMLERSLQQAEAHQRIELLRTQLCLPAASTCSAEVT